MLKLVLYNIAAINGVPKQMIIKYEIRRMMYNMNQMITDNDFNCLSIVILLKFSWNNITTAISGTHNTM